MLNKIIRFSLQNRLLVIVVAILLMVGGVYTASRMEVDVFPDLNAPTVIVMTEANSMASEEVERLVTFPIETAVNGANDVRRVRSSSTTGFSVVWVEFNWGTDIYLARQIVAEKLATIKDQLPPEVGNPTLGPQSSILGELMMVNLTSDTTSLQQLRTIADWNIRPRLLATSGVAQVAVLGGDIKEYQILLNPQKMQHYDISLPDVLAAVRGMNSNQSGGILYEYSNQYIIRNVVSTNDTSQLARSIVVSGNRKVMLRDIAQVTIGNKSPKMGMASYNGKPSVVLTITKQPNISTLQLTRQLDTTLAKLKTSLPRDVKMNTEVYRQEHFINSSINNVKKSLLEGAFFVIIVLFIFLMNTRTTIISLITIPLSLLVAIVVLKTMGLTINTMSLGGMCIAIGSLVDDAIVDVENVLRHMRLNSRLPKPERRPILSVIYNACREVRMPILNSTLIIVVSFVPLFFLSGMEGRMLVPLGIAFIVALAASTLVALTLTPVLCSYLLKAKDADDQSASEAYNKEPIVARKLKKHYTIALKWALRNRKMVLGTTMAALIVALVAFFSLGRSFLPPFNEGSFTININTLPGISLEESDKLAHKAEKALLTIPEIKAVGRKTGRAELDEHALGVNSSEIEAPYELNSRTKEELLADIRDNITCIPGVSVEVGSPISHRIDAMLSGTKASIAIKLFGTDLNTMFNIGQNIRNAISNVEGIVDLNMEQQVERPQLTITPQREMLAQYGITIPQFNEMVRTLLSGETVSQVYEDNRTYDLTLKVDNASRQTAEQISRIAITANGAKIPLGSIADVKSTVGPNTINRENVERKIVISANVASRDIRSVVNDIQNIINSRIKLPEGYHIEYGGQFESEQTASRTLLITSFFSVLAIFLLLFGQFRSTMQSGVILLNLPLALIGGVFAIWLTTGQLNIPAIIGFISLFGIATRNGMLLITRYNDLRRQGHSAMESVMMGSSDRLNPILMTALTSALALIPLVIGGEMPGNEIQSPMAKVILGGLFTSTLLNGFIIPIMYLMMEKKKQQTS